LAIFVSILEHANPRIAENRHDFAAGKAKNANKKLKLFQVLFTD
jgi:hypothetical protein